MHEHKLQLFEIPGGVCLGELNRVRENEKKKWFPFSLTSNTEILDVKKTKMHLQATDFLKCSLSTEFVSVVHNSRINCLYCEC